MTRQEALHVLISRSVVIVRFVKRNGELRRMVCQYQCGTCRRNLLSVWDIERGATRIVNLSTIKSLKPMPSRPHTEKAADRPAVPPQRSLEEARQVMHESF